MNQEIRNKIYLAALLHDIGKFYQRFDPNIVKNSIYLKQDIKNLEGTYCPFNNFGKFYTHKHVLWTAQFFDDHRKKINKIFGLPEKDDTLMSLASSHHKPSQDNELAMIIQLADILSSAAEREDKKQDYKDDEKGRDKFKKIPLYSVFDKISLLEKDEKRPDKKLQNPIKTQKLTINEFPNANKDYVPDYTIWEKFIEEFIKMPDTLSPENFIQTLDALLHKYTYCIPSSTMDEPDISLYDHLKTTAFLAISLYDYLQSNNLSIKNITDNDKAFILLGGDISGIQDFIYDIPNDGAAKQLKGRSFYINLLTEIIVRFILKDFNALHLNVVYCSGGNFYLLLPNSNNIKDKIKKLSSDINKELLTKFGTDIYLAMEYEEVSIANLKQKECPKNPAEIKCLSQIWDNLISEKIFKAKNQRYLNGLKNNYKTFFEPELNFKDEKKEKIFSDKLEQLGKNLKKAKYLIFSAYKHPNISDKHCINEFGLNSYLVNDLPDDFENAEIIKFNDTEFIENAKENNTYRFEFYGGNDFPVDNEGHPKTFEELAKGKNFDRLGIVRMDVDNLGKIFAEGFDAKLRTFSRLTSLSRNLDFFFKGYLNTVWKSKKEYQENTYILYSGGDDLFVLGRWDIAINFALDVKKAFSEFTKSNEIGISGGISIEKPKFPIRRGADNAGKVEGKAKDFCIEKNKVDNNYIKPYKKNAFTLFNVPLSWQSDFEKVLEIKNHLKEYDKKKNISHSLINSIKMFYNLKEFQQQKGKTESWRWTMAYYLQRSKERLSNNDVDFKYYIEDLKTSIFADTYNIKTKKEPLNSNHSFLKLLAVAARWAELEMRTEK